MPATNRTINGQNGDGILSGETWGAGGALVKSLPPIVLFGVAGIPSADAISHSGFILSRKRWEYLSSELDITSPQFTQVLSQQGDDGWELVTILAIAGGVCCYASGK